MSRLDELIAELCPDGVIYKRFDETCTLHARIGWQRLTKAEYKMSGDYMLVTGTDFTPSNEVNYKSCVYVSKDRYVQDPKIQIKDGDVLITKDGTLGKVAQVNNLPMPATLNGGVFVVRPKDDSLLPRYIMYFLLSGHFQKVVEQQKTGSTISHLTQALFSRLLLPVPPLEVQREIVHILDSFTLLTAELTAELTARKKQYEFYRNKLLTFDNNVKIVPLADIADIGTGSSNTNEGVEEGKYPFYVRSQEPLRKNEYEYDETAIITAGDGVGVGKVFHYVEGKYALHQRAYRIHINTPDVLPRYYFHYMRSAFLPYIQKTMFQGSVASIRRPMLNQFPVPVPALDVQKRLVNVLDNFESICTDLNIGLPAEIEARQKQYEYYRDLLLTFAETGSTLMTDRQTDRQTELSAIKLIQYVFGYATVSLDYIVNFRNGKGHEKNIVSDGKYIVVNSKFISTDGQVKKYADEQICPLYVNDILMVMSDLPNGRALAKCYLVDEDDKYTLNQRIGAFTVSRPDLVTTKYLYYILSRNPQLLRYDNGADQTNLRKADILNILIVIPTVKEQKKITEILDRFDILCNDLSTGLPAEIEARQKQYEYYRDKLLSFKELPK